MDAALPCTKKETYVTPRLRLSAEHEGTVALYDELTGRDIVVFDPASAPSSGRSRRPGVRLP